MAASKAGIILATTALAVVGVSMGAAPGAGRSIAAADEPKASPAGGGEGVKPGVTAVALKELNTDHLESGPWVASDGRALYWSVFHHRLGPSIWTATRPDTGMPFGKRERLFSGAYPTLTADGLIMVLNRRGALWTTRRTAADQPFPKPTAIAELSNGAYCRRACLSEDGLTLYFERIRGRTMRVELCVTRRRSTTSAWETPTLLEVDLARTPGTRLSCPFVFRNGSILLCVDDRRTEPGTSNFMVWTRSRPDGPFDTSQYLDVAGVSARGHCPRYLASTGELFYSSERTRPGAEEARGPDLYVLKDLRLPLPGPR